MPPFTPCCSAPSYVASVPPPQKMRPRGLWRARANPAPRPASHATPDFNFRKHYFSDLLSDDDDASSDASSRKRARAPSTTPPTDDEEIRYWDYSRKCSPHPERLDKWTTRMDTTSTAIPPANEAAISASCDIEDWEDLKELFARAAEVYENQQPTEAMPLLRGVIHECHRFMRLYYDPSIVYTPPAPLEGQSQPGQIPSEQRVIRDWLADRPPLYPPQASEKDIIARARARDSEKEEKKCKCKDLPTAFYTILGTTLFFFANLIDQEPSLTAPGEADRPSPYWLSALDVFEIGENLPIRTSGRGCPSAPEDWRMAIIWGRTLVALSHEALALEKEGNGPPLATRELDSGIVDPTSDPFAGIAATFSFRLPKPGVMPSIGGVDDTDDHESAPKWPAGSPFALINERRLPRTGRLSLKNTSADEMMTIAKDQFSRGIFHMPHPLHARRGASVAPRTKTLPAVFTFTPPIAAYLAALTQSEVTAEPSPATDAQMEEESPSAGPGLLPGETFSRAKELFTIASEVLDVAERFPSPDSRANLASFADGVLSQMKLEACAERAAYGLWARAGAIVLARGRANLVVGTAKAEEIEERIENGDDTVWDSDEAIDGREALGVAIVYLEKAREALVACRAEEAGDAIVVEPADADQGLDAFDDMDESQSDEGGDAAQHAPSGHEETSVEEVNTMLAEALLTLANLTRNPKEREVLYSRAQREGGDAIVLDEWEDEDGMDV